MDDKEEIKWNAVKEFYEANYFDERGAPMRFRSRPDAKDVDILWDKMQKMIRNLDAHYMAYPFLLRRYHEGRARSSFLKSRV